MNILMIHDFYQNFGGEDAVALSEKEYIEQTDNLYFYSRHNNEIRQFGLFKKARFFVETIYSRRTVRDIRDLVSTFRPDFAYLHNIYPLISPSVYHALNACGVPIVQVMHDYRPYCPNGWFYTRNHICEACKRGNTLYSMLKRCYRGSLALSALYAACMRYCRRSGAFGKADAYICLTEFTRSLLLADGISHEKIFVRPNSIDVSEVTPAPGSGHYVGFIGRLSSEKGLWTLVRAFQQLDIPLKIAGSGPLENALRAYISENHVGNIELIGFVSGRDKWNFLRNSRFTVVPSEWYEAFGLVLLEAYAAGKPVVASRIGGLPTLVEDEKSGLLFSPGDSCDLAAKVRYLWGSQRLVSEMGAYARKLVQMNYSPASTYRQLMNIARTICPAPAMESISH